MFVTIAIPALLVGACVAGAMWLLHKLGEYVELKRTERAARRYSLSTAIYTLENLLEAPVTERGRQLMADNIFNRGTLPEWVERSQLATPDDVRATIALLKRALGWRGRKLHRQGSYQNSAPLELVPAGA